MATERTCLVLEASDITYDLAHEYERTKQFFKELLSGLDRHVPDTETCPQFVSPFESGDEEKRVITRFWIRGLDHIILAVNPHESLLVLTVLMGASFDSAFVVGVVEDFYQSQQTHMHSFPMLARVSSSLDMVRLEEHN